MLYSCSDVFAPKSTNQTHSSKYEVYRADRCEGRMCEEEALLGVEQHGLERNLWENYSAEKLMINQLFNKQ